MSAPEAKTDIAKRLITGTLSWVYLPLSQQCKSADRGTKNAHIVATRDLSGVFRRNAAA